MDDPLYLEYTRVKRLKCEEAHKKKKGVYYPPIYYKIYCKYCDFEFTSTSHAYNRHVNRISHKKNVSLYKEPDDKYYYYNI